MGAKNALAAAGIEVRGGVQGEADLAVAAFLEDKLAFDPDYRCDHHDHEHEDGVCCGRHTNCAKGYDNSNLYFDDEELDRFKGKKQEEYSESDIEEFRHVLYTMKENEVDTWAHCLQTRGIEIPQEVKDEILLMLQ